MVRKKCTALNFVGRERCNEGLIDDWPITIDRRRRKDQMGRVAVGERLYIVKGTSRDAGGRRDIAIRGYIPGRMVGREGTRDLRVDDRWLR